MLIPCESALNSASMSTVCRKTKRKNKGLIFSATQVLQGICHKRVHLYLFLFCCGIGSNIFFLAAFSHSVIPTTLLLTTRLPSTHYCPVPDTLGPLSQLPLRSLVFAFTLLLSTGSALDCPCLVEMVAKYLVLNSLCRGNKAQEIIDRVCGELIRIIASNTTVRDYNVHY